MRQNQRTRARICLVGLLLALLLGACGPRGGELPWQEDFSSPGTWLLESDATAEVAIQDGVLRITVNALNQLAWATAGKDLKDFRLAVEATQVSGPNDNEYGVLIRMQDRRNFYAFAVSGDGYFLVSQFLDGVRKPLGGDWAPSDAIRQGAATNVLEVTAQGHRFTFAVNGQTVAEFEDDHFSHGDIGLYAGSFYEGGVV
ncbi:MAG: DUF1080 domain-containing protein, partial [Thermoflexia bacterium]